MIYKNMTSVFLLLMYLKAYHYRIGKTHSPIPKKMLLVHWFYFGDTFPFVLLFGDFLDGIALRSLALLLLGLLFPFPDFMGLLLVFILGCFFLLIFFLLLPLLLLISSSLSISFFRFSSALTSSSLLRFFSALVFVRFKLRFFFSPSEISSRSSTFISSPCLLPLGFRARDFLGEPANFDFLFGEPFFNLVSGDSTLYLFLALVLACGHIQRVSLQF